MNISRKKSDACSQCESRINPGGLGDLVNNNKRIQAAIETAEKFCIECNKHSYQKVSNTSQKTSFQHESRHTDSSATQACACLQVISTHIHKHNQVMDSLQVHYCRIFRQRSIFMWHEKTKKTLEETMLCKIFFLVNESNLSVLHWDDTALIQQVRQPLQNNRLKEQFRVWVLQFHPVLFHVHQSVSLDTCFILLQNGNNVSSWVNAGSHTLSSLFTLPSFFTYHFSESEYWSDSAMPLHSPARKCTTTTKSPRL